MNWDITLYALRDLPIIKSGDDLGILIGDLASEQIPDGLQDHDVVVVAQKIVSKAESRVVRLADVRVSPEAERLAELTKRRPEICQLYIDESARILGVNGRHVVTLHRLGFEGTGAGVDLSNTDADGEHACLLPLDPDASARAIRNTIRDRQRVDAAVVVTDSMGDRNRAGAVGKALGIAGIRHLEQPDELDLFGAPSRPMMNRIDEIASAASILMGQSGAGTAVVIMRGVPFTEDEEADITKMLIPSDAPAFDF